MTRPISRILRWSERFFLAVGIAALCVWAGSVVIPAIWQGWENRTFDLARRNPDVTRRHVPDQVPRPAHGTVVGRLSIPRLSLTSMVREGDDDTTLSLALGHIPSTALPGQSGNVGVAGHRDTLFRALKEIRNKDLIRFETLAGSHVYEVDSTKIVQPEDVGVLKPGKTPELTLVTCYPFYYVGSAPERFIVSAHEVSGERASEVTREVTDVLPESTPDVTPAPVIHKTSSAIHITTSGASATTLPAILPTGRPATTSFNVRKGHGQEVAPGISFGVTDTNARDGRVYGWLWLMPDRRTILLRDQAAGDPLLFYQDGKRRELLITSVSENAVRGSLLLPAE